MNIVPAIEEKTVEEFAQSLQKVVGFADRVHVDFNDGSFEEFVSIKPEGIGLLPQDINFEAHLMVARPFDYIPKLKEIGFTKFIIQWETADNIRDVCEQLMEENVLVGVAIAPETPISDIEPVLETLDSVTIMTIVPGKQGQEFLADNLKKIQDLHEGNFFGEIEVDGGVNVESIANILTYKPETLVVGSYIINSPNPAESYENLVNLTS